ncbi:MAG: phosphoribosyl-ATP diphosphatase [Parvularculales bacterium]
MVSATHLDDLERLVQSRQKASPDTSYTAQLFAEGVPVCARKFGEEAVETIIAATTGSTDELVRESADLLYHWIVLLAARGVSADRVYDELARRAGTSGLDEKSTRR